MITRTITNFTTKFKAPRKGLGQSIQQGIKLASSSFSEVQSGRKFSTFLGEKFKTQSQTARFFKQQTRHFHSIVEPLGPLDGRYQPKIEPLTHYFSESAFNRYRIKVEISWLQFLIEDRVIKLEEEQSLEETIEALQ